MKHPVLGRVFAVVLAILCVILLVTGIRGFDKADAERAERLAYEEKYAGRIESYLALEEELAGSISYEQAQEEFDKLLDQHESDASQHRTDTALYTAEKGGNILGADLIWQAKAELKEAKGELEEANRLLASFENAYAAVKGDVAQIVALASADAAASGGQGAALNPAIARVAALLAAEPRLPEGFVLPEDPGEAPGEPPEPTLPAPGEAPPEPGPAPTPPGPAPTPPAEDADETEQAAYEEALAEYEAALADYQEALSAWEKAQEAWNAYLAQKTAYDEAWADYNSAKEAYDSYPARKAAYEAALLVQQQYDTAHAAWEEELAAASAELPLEEGMAALEKLGGDLQVLSSRTQQIMTALGPYADSLGGLGLGGEELAALTRLAALGDTDFSSMTPEQRMQAAREIAQELSAMSGSFQSISGALGQIDAALAEAKNQVFAAELALKKAEEQMQYQLALIWRNLGDLEKDAEKLAEEKEKLDGEAEFLSKKLIKNDELKELTRRRNSLRLLLTSVPEVKAESEETGDLPTAAGHHLETWRAQTDSLYALRHRIHLLAIIAAVAGILGIPGAYELLKGRFFQLVPVLVCLGCTAGAEWLQVTESLGQHYAALFTAIFAALQLLILLPKKKKLG